ncbi:recombination regulator RecX [Metabacillus sp. RGM 3146]|uniref:recombination regulator RecX n=1 Tax=Metabacillus sp. RGM 3146 TaxID=3401092 RepID=UPI003B9B33DB
MAYVTKITAQKKLKDRYNIFLDKGNGEEYAFSVDETTLIKFGLRKGLEIDELDIVEIQYGDDVRKAYNAAINYLSYRMRSKGEIRTHLLQKEYEEAIIQEVLHQLEEYNYINDGDFAEALVRTHWKTNGKGPGVIRQELIQKGVGQADIERALSVYFEEAQIEEALKIIEKEVKKSSGQSTIMLKQKLEQSLLRKGFSFAVISSAIQSVDYENSSEMEMEALILQAEKIKRRYSIEDDFTYKMKMKQYLYRKGFSLDLIDAYLQEQE